MNKLKELLNELSEEEYQHYQMTRSLFEFSDAYQELFNGYGWVLQQRVFCDLCKYDSSEVYSE